MMDRCKPMESTMRLPVLIIITVGLLGVLMGCGGTEGRIPAPTATTAPEPTPTSVVKEDVEPPPAPPETTLGDPGDVVTAFYDGYLGYEGDPLADQAYHDHDLMADDFESEIDRRIAESAMEGFDPLVCSREMPDAIVLGTIDRSGDVAHVIVNSASGRHFFSVTLHVERTNEPHWQITNVDCMIDAPPQSEDGAGGPQEVVEGWPVFVDDTYHFMVQYPEGWTYEEVDLDDPNKPPAGKMERLVMFYPQGWDEPFNPLHLEVYVMDDEVFAAEHMPGDSSEIKETATGQEMVVETYVFGEARMTKMIFRSPSNPDVRVIFTDYLTGWPDRLSGNEKVAEALDPMLASFGFTE